LPHSSRGDTPRQGDNFGLPVEVTWCSSALLRRYADLK
jgi:hypothetical protein